MSTKKKVIILGSTGSIGRQTLDIIKNNLGEFEVVGLSVNTNIELLKTQIDIFSPQVVAINNRKNRLSSKIDILYGEEGIINMIENYDADIVVNALVGFAGLSPTLSVLKTDKRLLLANKESLVVAGGLINKMFPGKHIIPLDSEHSAIFQCLNGEDVSDIEKIFLTCSGGPFYKKKLEDLKRVSVDDALKHPNWVMGSKITIDSATLMNKGFELIEAMWLFGLALDQIDIVIHRESICHSMVQFSDGNIIAQINLPDMRYPISYGLFYPGRRTNNLKRLDIFDQNWTFGRPDTNTFRLLELTYKVIKKGGTYPVALNTANEIAVSKFLSKEISFIEIMDLVEEIIGNHIDRELSISNIYQIDSYLRDKYKI